MWLTGLLQSLAPVLPPIARNRNVYITPGVSPVTIISRVFWNIPALTHAPPATCDVTSNIRQLCTAPATSC